MPKTYPPIWAMITIVGLSAACGNDRHAAEGMEERDYQELSGTWRLTRAVVDGHPLPAEEVKNTILITDGNTFRFPEDSGAATHPAGTFTINPSTKPKQVDSVAEGGSNAGQKTLGIYEIIDATHKRACWAPPGVPRPSEFESLPGSKRTLQYWEKIGPVPTRK